MSTPTHTLFGYDHLAHGMRSATPGIKTGASSRPGGKTHLFDTVTKLTACGRERGQMAVTLVPANVTEVTWPVRVVLCSSCRKQVAA